MNDPGDAADEVVDDVEQFLEPDDDSAAGKDMPADAVGGDDDPEGDPGLPPAGDDPMDGAAPSG